MKLKNLMYISMLSTTFALSGCGGSSSSSGGEINTAFVGTYDGGGNQTLSLPSQGISEVERVRVVVVINSSGNVAVSDGSDDVNTQGQLSGNTFQTSGSVDFDVNGVRCRGPISYTGNLVNENTVIGSVSADNITCSGSGGSTRLTISGDYTSNRVSNNASIRNNNGQYRTIQDALPNL